MAIKIAVLYHRMCGYKDSRFISEDVWQRMCGYKDSRFRGCVAIKTFYIRGCVAIKDIRGCGFNDNIIDVWLAVLYQRMCGYKLYQKV